MLLLTPATSNCHFGSHIDSLIPPTGRWASSHVWHKQLISLVGFFDMYPTLKLTPNLTEIIIAQPASQGMKGALREWVQHISSYAKEHKLSVTFGHPFPDSLRDVVLKQATPSLFRGDTALFITVGSGISMACFLGN